MAPRRIGLCNHCRKPIEDNAYYCSLECAFWFKVDVRDPGQCWPWTGAKLKPYGYGAMAIRSKPTRITTAHRVSLAIKLGRPIDADIQACHHCDNPSCVNPSHLYEGTPKKNNEDKVSRDRQSKGENHGRGRLTEEQARAILVDTRTHQAIADEYNIARTAVTRIKNGTRWRHLAP